MNYTLSDHAKEELILRQIPRELLDSVIQNPQQIVPERGDKKAYQSQVDFGNGKIFLLRVIVNDTIEPAIVVTAYRTKNVNKYWRKS